MAGNPLTLLSGGVDITQTVRIKCAAKECDEIDLCPSCFSEGKEVQKHKAWHDYRVVVCRHVFLPDCHND